MMRGERGGACGAQRPGSGPTCGCCDALPPPRWRKGCGRCPPRSLRCLSFGGVHEDAAASFVQLFPLVSLEEGDQDVAGMIFCRHAEGPAIVPGLDVMGPDFGPLAPPPSAADGVQGQPHLIALRCSWPDALGELLPGIFAVLIPSASGRVFGRRPRPTTCTWCWNRTGTRCARSALAPPNGACRRADGGSGWTTRRRKPPPPVWERIGGRCSPGW